jgi:NADP-dependent 3-hydroxy acid dehydrogenase YdfG
VNGAIQALIAASQLIREIADMVRDGLSDEDIRVRLADPSGVGQKLIDAARSRKQKIKDFKEGA